MIDKEIKCPCGYREYMEEHQCKQTDCNKCCPLTLQDIVDNQQAEIERITSKLKKRETELDRLTIYFDEAVAKKLETAKAEAIKEFAERFESKVNCIPQHHFTLSQVLFELDKTKKEMVGEQG